MRDIDEIRREIDVLDARLMKILAARQKLVWEVGRYKKTHNLPALSPARKKEVLEKFTKSAAALGVEDGFAAELYELIHRYAVKIEEKI